MKKNCWVVVLKIFVDGYSKPFVVGADSSNKAKQLAHQMIRNSSVKITKIVKEHGDDVKEINFKVDEEINELITKVNKYYEKNNK